MFRSRRYSYPGLFLASAALVVNAASAAAQTPPATETLTSLRDATLRAGAFASTRYGTDPILETRASDAADYVRRAVLMFDTKPVLPATAQIASAQLVLTVKSGNPETRSLSACAVPVSFDEPTVSWNRRNASTGWSHPGGDTVSADCSVSAVTALPNAKVVFDVTLQVQKAVRGTYGTPYARFLVEDTGGSSRDSYKQYYSNNDPAAATRPMLIVSTGAPAAPPAAGDISIAAGAFATHGAWTSEPDGTLRNPDGGAGKIVTASASPADYIEASFEAQAGVGYRIWLHGYADANSWANDSVFAQFSGSVTAGGAATWRVGTTSAAEINLEDCRDCGLSGWTWQDDGWGSAEALGPLVYFAATGTQTIRIQTREDGLAFDEILLSPSQYVSSAPPARSGPQPPGPSPVDPLDPPAQPVQTDPPPVGLEGSATLRVLQWNSHHGGYGTDNSYDPDRLATWMVQFNPDVISLNEIEYFTGWGNEDQPARYAALLQQKTGVPWYYRFTTATGATNGNGNLILSRIPFQSTGVELLTDSRAAVAATIVVNGRTITFTSTHLDDDSSSTRMAEIGELKTWEQAMAEPRIIAGDFNAQPSTPEIVNMTSSGYTDGWAQAVKNHTATSWAANPNGNTRHTRIDYIFYSSATTVLVLDSVQVFDTANASGVQPSDHNPVLAVFEVK